MSLEFYKSSHIGNVNDLVNAINSQQPRVIEDFSYTINVPKQAIVHHLGKLRRINVLKVLEN